MPGLIRSVACETAGVLMGGGGGGERWLAGRVWDGRMVGGFSRHLWKVDGNFDCLSGVSKDGSGHKSV